MGFFDKRVEPPAAPPAPPVTEAWDFAEIMEAANNGFRVGDTPLPQRGFVPYSQEGMVRLADIVTAVIRPVISRALQAEMICDDTTLLAAARRVNPSYSPRQFWAEVFTSILTHGNVLFFQRGQNLHFAPGGAINIPIGGDVIGVGDRQAGTWLVIEYDPAKGISEDSIHVPYNEACLAKFQPVPYATLGVNPLEDLKHSIAAYVAATELSSEYAQYGHKVGSELSMDAAVLDVARAKKYVLSVSQLLSKAGQFLQIYTERGFSLKPGPKVDAPKLDELFNNVVRAVCRYYGVPPTLLATFENSGRQMLAEDMEDHLLRDGVEPILDVVADAVTKVLRVEENQPPLRYNTTNLAKPGFSGRVRALKDLAQAGVAVQDELRELIALPPRPNGEGQRMPETAGAAPRGAEEKNALPPSTC